MWRRICCILQIKLWELRIFSRILVNFSITQGLALARRQRWRQILLIFWFKEAFVFDV